METETHTDDQNDVNPDEDDEEQSDVNVGGEHVKEVVVSFCELCHFYISHQRNSERAVKRHCTMRTHLRNFIKYKDDLVFKEEQRAKQLKRKEKRDAKAAAEKAAEENGDQEEEKEEEEEEKVKEEGEKEATKDKETPAKETVTKEKTEAMVTERWVIFLFCWEMSKNLINFWVSSENKENGDLLDISIKKEKVDEEDEGVAA